MTNFDYNEIVMSIPGIIGGIRDMGLTEWLKTNWQIALTSIIGIYAILASVTPNHHHNKYINIVLKVINFLGCNFGKAKNNLK